MLCSCRSSCLGFPVALVNCQVEGCLRRLHHVCQGEYELLNCINRDGGEQKVCCNCVDKIGGGGSQRF